MRKGLYIIPAILLMLLLAGSLEAQKLPDPVGFVNDFAGVIDSSSSAEMEAIARALQQKTGAEIAVVVVETVGDEHYTEYANKLFEKWGIGQKGKDNGILIFQTVRERNFRIEVGYGLEVGD